jgi:hypothetical protein
MEYGRRDWAHLVPRAQEALADLRELDRVELRTLRLRCALGALVVLELDPGAEPPADQGSPAPGGG